MTGFKFRWYYTDQENNLLSVPSNSKVDNLNNKLYSKFVNIIHFHNNTDKVYSAIENQRRQLVRRNEVEEIECDLENHLLLNEKEMELIINTVENEIGNSSIDLNKKYKIPEANLEEYARIFFHLTNCPDSSLEVFRKFLKELFDTNNVQMIIITLNKVNTQLTKLGLLSELKVSKFFLQKLTEILSLKHINLGLMNAGTKIASYYQNNLKNFSFNNLETHKN